MVQILGKLKKVDLRIIWEHEAYSGPGCLDHFVDGNKMDHVV
jgi:hypothetical protein